MSSTEEFSVSLKNALVSDGFLTAGFFDWDSLDSAWWQAQTAHYQKWIAQGHHQKMEYLVRGTDRRTNPKLVFPELQSVLMVSVPYSSVPLGFESDQSGPKYARYLRSGDYHQEISERLAKMLSRLKIQFNHLEWKQFVDTSAVLERALAAACGLGWIGKNSMLIHPKIGSYTYLGGAFLSLKTGATPHFQPNLCGQCEACLEGCPTQALSSDGLLNSKRCISYQTLENRSELELSSKDLNGWIAGCDRCQEVCPFNLKKSKEDIRQMPEPETDMFFKKDWNELEALDEAQYRSNTRHLALQRVKFSQFVRNIKAILNFND